MAAYARLNLTRREADLAIRLTNTPPEHLVGRKLTRLTWSLYCRDDLVDRPPAYLAADDDRPRPDWCGDLLGERVPLVRINDPALLVPAIRGGMGAGTIPDRIAARYPELRLLRAVPEDDVDLWVLTHPDLRHTARIRALMDVLVQYLG